MWGAGEGKDQGSRGTEDGKGGSLREAGVASSLRETKSEPAWRLVPRPPLPRPSHTRAELRAIYTPQQGSAEPPSTPARPCLGSAPEPVRRDGAKPASGPQRDVYSQRTGATGVGSVARLRGAPPSPPVQSLTHLSWGQAGGRLASQSSPGPLGVMGSADHCPTRPPLPLTT